MDWRFHSRANSGGTTCITAGKVGKKSEGWNLSSNLFVAQALA